jgi:chemotaxis protein methyltransferase CheR
MSNLPELSEKEYLSLRDLVHDEFGILFRAEKLPFLRLRLLGRLEGLGLSTFDEYIQYLKYDRDRERERRMMIALLTNNETYFFRELPQLKAYREVVLSELRDRKLNRESRRINVVSAGCSTGEEVHSLAMLTYETGWFFWGWDVRIHGIDINQRNLETARKAEYFDRSLRMMDRNYLDRYFRRNGGSYYVKESVAGMSRFVHGNITSPAIWNSLCEVDVIFCRNVMIYFSEEKVRRTVDLFHGALEPGGYLFLGHSETLVDIHDGFEQIYLPGTILYRKRG